MRPHLRPEPVESLVEVEHPTALTDVGRSPLRGGRYSPPFLALLCVVELRSVRGILLKFSQIRQKKKKKGGTLTALRSGVALCPRNIVGILTNREWFYGNTWMPTISKTNETF